MDKCDIRIIVFGDKLAMNDNSVRAYDLFPTPFSLVGKHFPKSYLEIVDCNTCWTALVD